MKWILLALVAITVAAQQADPDDPNPEWPGQKASCSNKTCACEKTQCGNKKPDLSGNGMGPKCNTWCKPDHCSCACLVTLNGVCINEEDLDIYFRSISIL